MQSRRAIRETAIQFLYSSDLEGGAAAEDYSDIFWDLSLESDSNKLLKATAKSILHLNQGREARHSKLVERSEEALALVTADIDAKMLKKSLKDLLKLESKWQATTDRIQRLYEPGVEHPSDDLKPTIDELYTLNAALTETRLRWNYLLQDFPALAKRLSAITAAVTGLQRVSDRIKMVQNPEKFASDPGIKPLNASVEKMALFRKNVDSLTHAILHNKAEIDSTLEEVVQNYKPERIDPVDRAILRLGCYEILFKEEIPAPVTMNECIEIARRFGTTDSPKFINGVLDKISKRD